MKEIIDTAVPMIEFVVRQKAPDLNSTSPKKKESICRLIFESLIEIDSRIALEGYLEQLRKLLIIPVDVVKSDFSRYRKPHPQYRKDPEKKDIPSKRSDRLTIAEEDLLFVLLHDDRLASPLAHTLDISWVDSRPTAGRILAKILSETIAENALLFCFSNRRFTRR